MSYGGLSSGWYVVRWPFIRVVCFTVSFHQGGVLRWPFIRVVCRKVAFHHGGISYDGLSSGWYVLRWPFIRVVCLKMAFHQGGISSRWPFVRNCIRSGWSFVGVIFIRVLHFIRVILHLGDISSGWSLVSDVFDQGGIYSAE